MVKYTCIEIEVVGVSTSSVKAPSRYFLIEDRDRFVIRTLVGDGKSIDFNLSGTFVGMSQVSMLGNKIVQEVDIVSVLVHRSVVEVATSIGGEFQKVIAMRELTDLMKILPTLSGFVFTATIPYPENCMQYLYMYRLGNLPKGMQF